MRKTVAVDLDGVLNLYSGWTGDERDFAPPRAAAREFTLALREKGYEVVVFTTRDVDLVEDWLHANRIHADVVTNEKPKALVYVDDRAICFEGSFEGLVERIDTFKAHWESPE